PAHRRPGDGQAQARHRAHRRLGARPRRREGGQGPGRGERRGGRTEGTRGTAAALMNEITNAAENRRQVLYWRLLARLFDPQEQPALETAGAAVVKDIGLPTALLDPATSVDTVVQRYPELAEEFRGLTAGAEDAPAGAADGASGAGTGGVGDAG